MTQTGANGLARPLRKHVALAVDGGGIKGVMVARALMDLERAEGRKIPEIFHLTAGTSTGAIIAAAIARGLDAERIHALYRRLGERIFRKSWRTWPIIRYLVRYRYKRRPFDDAVAQYLGDVTMGELHRERPDFHMVITASDIYANETRFVKLYKERYAHWLLRQAVTASSIVPTVFSPLSHAYRMEAPPPEDPEAWIPEPRYWVDGGVGSYSNPCYMAAYEIAFCLRAKGWALEDTTLISIGTGNSPVEKAWRKTLKDFRRNPAQLYGPEWIMPILDTFLRDANLQQMRLVKHFFVDAVRQRANDPSAGLDFRRYNVDFEDPIDLDSAASVQILSERYGPELGRKIVQDEEEEIGAFRCGKGEVLSERVLAEAERAMAV